MFESDELMATNRKKPKPMMHISHHTRGDTAPQSSASADVDLSESSGEDDAYLEKAIKLVNKERASPVNHDEGYKKKSSPGFMTAGMCLHAVT